MNQRLDLVENDPKCNSCTLPLFTVIAIQDKCKFYHDVMLTWEQMQNIIHKKSAATDISNLLLPVRLPRMPTSQ